MSNRDSFILHSKELKQLHRLKDSDRLLFFDSLVQLLLTGKEPEPEFSEMGADLLFDLTTERIYDDWAYYEERCRQNSINGKKGGRPKKANGLPEKQTVLEKSEKSERFIEKPKKAYYDSDSDSDFGFEAEAEAEGVSGGQATASGRYPTEAEIARLYQNICRSKGVTTREGVIQRFMDCGQYKKPDYQDIMLSWVEADITTGKYNRQKPKTNRFNNFSGQTESSFFDSPELLEAMQRKPTADSCLPFEG